MRFPLSMVVCKHRCNGDATANGVRAHRCLAPGSPARESRGLQNQSASAGTLSRATRSQRVVHRALASKDSMRSGDDGNRHDGSASASHHPVGEVPQPLLTTLDQRASPEVLAIVVIGLRGAVRGYRSGSGDSERFSRRGAPGRRAVRFPGAQLDLPRTGGHLRYRRESTLTSARPIPVASAEPPIPPPTMTRSKRSAMLTLRPRAGMRGGPPGATSRR